MKGIKNYKKPIMVVEKFTPNEFVAVCWYIDEGDCYTNLYHDTQQTLIISVFHGQGYYWGYLDDNETLCENHPSHRVPSSTASFPYIKSEKTPSSIDDDKYYTAYEAEYSLVTGWSDKYTVKASDVYLYNDGTTIHYFKKPTEAGNHS